MAQFADRVKETTTTTGTGTITLAGAVTQYQSFNSAFSTGALVYYTVISGNGTDWESGLGTFTSSGTTLARTKVIVSTNSNAAISLTGTSFVFADIQAVHARKFGGAVIITPPVVSNWTQLNIGSPAAASDSDAGVVLTDNFTNTFSARVLLLAAPTAPYTIDALLTADLPALPYATVGMCFSDGTKIQPISISQQSSATQQSALGVSNYNSATSYGSEATPQQNWFCNPSEIWLRLNDDGAGNVNFSHSMDGVTWNLRYSVAKSSGFLGSSGYTKVGFLLNAQANSTPSGTTFPCSCTLKSWYQH